jgi:hypothetical protein
MNLPTFLAITTALILPTHTIYIGDPANHRNASFTFDDYLTTFDHHDPAMHHHSRRWDTPPPADDSVWNRAVCKGRNLLAAIRETDQEAAGRYQPPPPGMTVQSPFKNYPQAFIDWGWSQYDAVNTIDEKYGYMDWHGWGIADALKGLGVSDKVVDDDDGRMLVAWMHHGPAWDGGHFQDVKGKPYTHDGKQYKFTDAHFVYAINSEEGAILALDLKGPATVVDWPKSELPGLHSGSDIMYGVWKSMLEGHAADSLRYYGVVGITNVDTKGIIVRAVEDMDTEHYIQEWPGELINAGTGDNVDERFLALLGSPTGMALGYMLVQHKADMGKLRVIAVRVFLCNSENPRAFRMACIIFILKGEAPTPPQGVVPP